MAEYDLRRILLGLDEIFDLSNAYFIPGRTPDERVHFARMLDVILEATDSGIGFIARVRRDGGRRSMHTIAISDIAWDEQTSTLYAEHTRGGHDFHFDKAESLYGWVLDHERPLITNDPSGDPRAGGVPGGHQLFESFCCLPVFVGQRLVALLGLGNRRGGFTGEENSFLRPFLHQVGLSLQISSFFADARRTIAANEGREAVLAQQNNWYGHPQVWSSMAHDLNGIFSVISLQAQLLRADVAEPDAVLRGLDRIEESVRRVARYSAQLDLLGRIQAHDSPPSSLEESLDTIEFLVHEMMNPADRFTLESNLSGDVSIDLSGRELLAVLYAVVSNAVEAGDEHHVRLVVDRVHDGRVRLTVFDTGRGIPPSIRPLVTLHRVSSKDPAQRGTGLLAVRTLVEGIGGTVGISGDELGTAVVLDLPVTSARSSL